MLAVLVVIHEFGHFLFAKVFGVGVPVFSVGMGPRVLGIERGGTDYRISALPLGGYVRMAGADPFGEENWEEEDIPPEENFLNKPVWQRLVVMIAGPVANLILPLVLFSGVLMLGERRHDAVIGTVFADTPAADLGIVDDMRVLAVDDEPTDIWDDVEDALVARHQAGASLLLESPDGSRRTARVPADAIVLDEDGLLDLGPLGLSPRRLSSRVGVEVGSPLAQAGLKTGDAVVGVDGTDLRAYNDLIAALTAPGAHKLRVDRVVVSGDEQKIDELTLTLPAGPHDWRPAADDPLVHPLGITPGMLVVGGISKDSPAAAAGLHKDDRIYAVDGKVMLSWSHLTAAIGSSVDEAVEGAEAKPVSVTVVREGERVTVQLTPRIERFLESGTPYFRPIIGIFQLSQATVPGPVIEKYFGPGEALEEGAELYALLLRETLEALGNLLTGAVKPAESLGGPIQIFRMAGMGAEAGLPTFLRLMGQISISLGVLNLLPVPVLDGGQILFYAVEGIRGRPLSVAFREKAQMVGVLALVALMLMVFVIDIGRAINGDQPGTQLEETE